MDLPDVVSQGEWEAAQERFREREKEATRAGDALAAERRRLPRVLIDKEYVLQGANGEANLGELFEGRRQLLVYHFMFGPNQDEGCDGCSMFVDQVGHLAHLHARDTSFALVSRAPVEKLEAYRERMGWEIPWYSSADSDFNLDLGSPAASPASAPAPAADPGLTFDLNLDLGDQKAEAPAAPAPDLSSISLDLGGAGDAPAGGTDPKWQEIATKLDLAKAYEEMGDKDGARELLNEVMKDGDAAQKGTAQQLLAKLG